MKSSILELTCRETFPDIETNVKWKTYLIRQFPALSETIQSFERLKVRAEIDLVVKLSSFQWLHSMDFFFFSFRFSLSP